MKLLSELKNKDLHNKTCLLRVDFNIEDTDLYGYEHGLTLIPMRIEAVLPTIKFLAEKGAKIIIMSHRGRPQATRDMRQETSEFSLKPFEEIIDKLFENANISFLENLRLDPGEEKNDESFARRLAEQGDFYVNDAFSVCHREDASVIAITEFLPSYAGLNLEKEIKNLSAAIDNPKHPLILILGGAKISEKMKILENFLSSVDKILIGGDYENEIPFLNKLDKPRSGASSLRGRIVLPVDYIKKDKILDIGPKTCELYAEIIKNAVTIIWNGPMGLFENPEFAKGTEAITDAIVKSDAFAIIGGGETIVAFQTTISNFQFPISKSIFLSTGGGAMLEFLSGKKMPGLVALEQNKENL